MVYYAIENHLAGTDVTISSSSEDTLYVLENLYNRRPSKPFRFTGLGAGGNPEWICVEFDAPKTTNLAAVFNHNLTVLGGGAASIYVKADDGTCGGANWAAPDYSHDLNNHMIADWNDLYHILNETRLSFRLEVIDSSNIDGYLEIGEFFLGNYIALSTARLKPGRVESPKLYRAANVTHYGQHWTEAFSESITLDLVVQNLNDPATVDAVRKMIFDIHANGDRFVIIPDHYFPFIYYVHLENDGGFMNQIIRGQDCELTAWTFNLRTLTKGIALL